MNIHQYIACLLAVFWSVATYGQECATFEGPITFSDQIDTTLVFPIYNLDSTDLSTNQSICAVHVSWSTQYPEDVQMILESPAGEQVILIGPIVINSGNVILETTWDVTFVPLDTTPMPDPGYSPSFNNSDVWTALFFGSYTGSYHPHNGHIDLLQAGAAYGEWKLRVIDGTRFHFLTLNDFSIEFCNPSGIDCTPCTASADTITPAIIDHCEGDANLDFSLLDHLTNPSQYTQGLDYDYYATIVCNDTVLAFQDPTDVILSDRSAEQYEVYGLAVDTTYRSTFPTADGSFTIDSLVAMIDSFPRIFCGDVTKDAVTVMIRPPYETDLTPSICQGDSFFVADTYLKDQGMYTFPLQSIHGCDSTVNVNLQVRASILSILDTSICFGDSIFINDRWISENTNDIDTLTASGGCDSLVIIDVAVRPYNFRTIQRTICEGDTLLFFDNKIADSGIYRDSITDQYGCDSVVVLDLDVVDRFVIDTTAFVCAGGSFTVGPTAYFASDFYQDTLTSTIGCDSIVNLNLIVRPRLDTMFSLTLCDQDSFAIGDTYYNTSGMYKDTLTSSVGCDSIVDLNLTVLPRSQSEANEVLCFGDSILSAGIYYKTTGVHLDTTMNSVGCDSFITLNLTIKDEIRTIIDSTICFGDSVIVGTNIYRQNGNYETVLAAADLCDSVVVLNLTVGEQIVGQLDTSICSGDSVIFNGVALRTAGRHDILYERLDQCDSLLVVDLAVKQPVIHPIERAICTGDSVRIGMNSYTATGVYRDTFVAGNGCDSVVILDLMVNEVFVTPLVEAICEGDSTWFQDRWLTDAGFYRYTLQTTAGCDSILALTVTVLSLSQPLELTEVLCPGDSLFFDDAYLKTAGIYSDTLVSSNGCDSLVIMDLSFRAVIQEDIPLTACLGDTITFDGRTYVETMVDSIIYPSSAGCDSLVILDIAINPCPIEVTTTTTDPTCGTLENGLIVVKADYGTAPYEYALALDGMTVVSGTISTYGDTAHIAGLDEGNYTLSITDGVGVVSMDNVVLSRLFELSVSERVVQDVSCFGQEDGTIFLDVVGGVAPYEFNWEDGYQGQSRDGLSTGQYLIYVEDDQGCENVFDFVVGTPDSMTFDISITPPSCAGLGDAIVAFINVEGGTGDYEYKIDGDYIPNASFSGLFSDTYLLTVKDSNGCLADGLAVIDDPVIYQIDLGEDLTIDLPETIDLSVASSLPTAMIEWSPPDGLSCTDCSNPSVEITRTISYRVQSTSDNGCVATDDITIILDIDRQVDVPQAFTPNGDLNNDVLIVHGNRAIDRIDLFEIYDRSGAKVFERIDFEVNDPVGWDGTFKGESLPSQVLAYFATVTYIDGKTLRFKGEITLIR